MPSAEDFGETLLKISFFILPNDDAESLLSKKNITHYGSAWIPSDSITTGHSISDLYGYLSTVPKGNLVVVYCVNSEEDYHWQGNWVGLKAESIFLKTFFNFSLENSKFSQSLIYDYRKA